LKKCNCLVFIEYNNLSREDTRRKHGNSKSIGKTAASYTYTYPSTTDGYWFVVTPEHNYQKKVNIYPRIRKEVVRK